jgi:hypothetical protein
MILAGNADIGWDRKKKNWIVSIHVGEQVIKRPSDKRVSQNADDDLLRAAAIQTARDDGYEVRPESVSIVRL